MSDGNRGESLTPSCRTVTKMDVLLLYVDSDRDGNLTASCRMVTSGESLTTSCRTVIDAQV